MSNNTKIFSEAIAEAKAIRETAMANAKLALEEAFAPRIQEMMSTKLEAMSYEEDKKMEEDYGQVTADATMDVANEEISLEELLAELDGLEEGTDKDDDDDKIMKENTIAEAEDDDEVGTITVKELKDMFREVMADVMGGGEEEEEAGEEEMEAGEEEMEAGEDDLELEEILAEIASLEEGDLEEGVLDNIKGAASKVYNAVQNAKPLPGMDKLDKFIDDTNKKEFGKDGAFDRALGKAGAIKAKFAAPVNFSKGYQESKLEEDQVEEGDWGTGAAAGNMSKYDDEGDLARWVKAAAAKAKMSVQAYLKSKGLMAANESELNEAMSTIATLRSELNEVNLLNAKLLYVNKLFKAKNLNEAQKVKVINAFDRAETVREAKNVFDTLNESLSTEKAKSQIKESLSFASKASGVSDRQPIMEGNDFVNRMQKLAGII